MSTMREDPDLGPAFESLDEVLDGYDVARVRPRPPRPIWPWGVGLAAIALLMRLGGSLLPTTAVPGEGAPPVPVVVLDTSLSRPAPVATDVFVGPIAGPAVGMPPVRTGSGPRPPDAVVVVEPIPDPAVRDPDLLVVVSPPVAEPPGGSLAAEEALYDSARTELDHSDWEGALAGADAYLLAFPHGRYRDKVGLLRVDALVGAGRWEQVVDATLALEDWPELSSRREQLKVLRGEALGALGRCEQAWQAVEGLARGETKGVRKWCP